MIQHSLMSHLETTHLLPALLLFLPLHKLGTALRNRCLGSRVSRCTPRSLSQSSPRTDGVSHPAALRGDGVLSVETLIVFQQFTGTMKES